jgi:hypothetical protein
VTIALLEHCRKYAAACLANGPKLERLDWAAVHIGKSLTNQEIIP